jgi:ABC-type phosphate transport system permease subunit
MLIITITDMGRNRFSYALAQNGKVQSIGHDAGVGPSAAAAKAVTLAMSYANIRYVILAPQEVLEFIPQEIRSGAWTSR